MPVGDAVSVVAFAEPFLRGPGRGGQPVYDRTRLFGGVSVRLSSVLDVRAGALVQQYPDATDVQGQLSLHHAVTL